MPFLKTIFCACLVFLFHVVQAQIKVTFELKALPSYHNHSDSIYIAGSFNGWKPADNNFRLSPSSKSITVDLPPGTIEYKFTRGSWEKVESAEAGMPTINRKLEVTKDTTVMIEIDHWGDHFPKTPRQSTAGKQVSIIDTAFYIPQLDRYRRIWIYLPSSYSTSQKKYPVLYMHDGQNVFDEATSYSGEWGVDESMDSLGVKHGEMIVVAIDHGGEKRINEYAPYDMEKYGRGEGDAYLKFLVKTLKPYIRKHYRAEKKRKHNYIAGSSMGGLISFYALLKYPCEFGGAGVFSPAFWINPQLMDIQPKKARKVKGRIYFFAGQQENSTMVPNMLRAFEQMHTHSKAALKSVIRADGRHDEATWRSEFPLFYKWITSTEPN